ncbi:MAG: DHHA1 domain-containing protein [Clostridia bacterium]|nr:DHHA1 domain-containing protein [Clostridia bacterium]
MSDLKQLTAEEFADRLLGAASPVILIHTKPDGDTVGTASSLVAFYRQRGVKAKIASDVLIPDRLAFLAEGIERVEDITAETGTLIAVDVAAPRQLGDLALSLEDGAKVAFMLDHHAVGTPFADNYILPDASSAGEVLLSVYKVLIGRGEMTLTPEIAYPLYAAICSDTGCFRFANTSPQTLRACADLLEVGIDGADISHRLFESKSAGILHAEGIAAAKTVALEDGISYAVISKQERDEAGLMPFDFETAIDVVRSLKGTEIAFVIKENDKKEYKVSLRSTGANVAAVAVQFGGGGHERAAGCAVPGETIEEATQTLISAIRAIRVPEQK